jgi:hypothetical protein
MKFSISKIVDEWSYRVKDGCPDPNNKEHLRILPEVLSSFDFSSNDAYDIVSNLQNPNKKIEDFQRFCVEIGKTLSEEELITEASISQAKYPAGTKIQLKPAMIDKGWWGKKFKGSKEPHVLTKVGLQDVPEERTTRGKSGTDEVCLLSGADGKIYKVIGTTSGIGTIFNHYKDEEDGVKWKAETLESAALAGLFFNPQSHLTALLSGNEKSAKSAREAAIKAMQSALSDSEMISGGIVATGIEKNVPDLILALQLAMGMYTFKAAMGIGKAKFIHRRIKQYYKAHNKNPKVGEAKGGGKVPTPDCIIIVKGSPDSLIANIEKDTVEYDGKGKCTTASGDIFYQISNKKSPAGAQLGRITGLVKKRYGLPGWSKGVSFMFEEIGRYENSEFLLNESLKDYFQKGLTYLKDKFSKTISAVRGKLKGIGSSIISSLKNTSTAPAEKILKDLSKGLKLEEAKENSWTHAQKIARAYHKNDRAPFNKIVGYATSGYSTISKKANSSNGISLTSNSESPVAAALPTGNDGANIVIKFVVNYLAYNTMDVMMSGQSGNIKSASKILEDFVELEKEMHYGSTNLPVIKVYMSEKGENAFTNMGGGAEFREKKSSIIDEFKTKTIPGLVIESSLIKGKGYTNNSVYVLNDFQQNGPSYTQIAYRSSGDNKLTFSVQGTTTRPWPWMLKNGKVKA